MESEPVPQNVEAIVTSPAKGEGVILAAAECKTEHAYMHGLEPLSLDGRGAGERVIGSTPSLPGNPGQNAAVPHPLRRSALPHRCPVGRASVLRRARRSGG